MYLKIRSSLILSSNWTLLENLKTQARPNSSSMILIFMNLELDKTWDTCITRAKKSSNSKNQYVLNSIHVQTRHFEIRWNSNLIKSELNQVLSNTYPYPVIFFWKLYPVRTGNRKKQLAASLYLFPSHFVISIFCMDGFMMYVTWYFVRNIIFSFCRTKPHFFFSLDALKESLSKGQLSVRP